MGYENGFRLIMLIFAFMIGFVGTTAILGGDVGSFVDVLVEDDPDCVLATDEDFSVTVNGEVRYIGSSDCVKIPHKIKDEEMTSYHKIRDMSYMFNDEEMTSYHKIRDMSYMFNSIQDTEVDLSNFDTTNVEDLSYMFLEVKPQN